MNKWTNRQMDGFTDRKKWMEDRWKDGWTDTGRQTDGLAQRERQIDILKDGRTVR
jgi:hypothetical protein